MQEKARHQITILTLQYLEKHQWWGLFLTKIKNQMNSDNMICLGMTELTCSFITSKHSVIPSFYTMFKGPDTHQYRKVTQISVYLLEDGSEVKYVNIIRRIPGSLHRQNMKTFAAIIPSKKINSIETDYEYNML